MINLDHAIYLAGSLGFAPESKSMISRAVLGSILYDLDRRGSIRNLYIDTYSRDPSVVHEKPKSTSHCLFLQLTCVRLKNIPARVTFTPHDGRNHSPRKLRVRSNVPQRIPGDKRI